MHKPYVAATQQMRELTFSGVFLGILLAALLAVSNTYLALKIGVLTPSSIPAAILSMGILRFFRHSNILINNQVQTCASAGEAIAGGIVYTAPALIIIHYTMGFDYLHTFLIALIGGMLGVLFTIPLRKVYVNDPVLHFPEGRAVAEVLMIGDKKTLGMRHLFIGAGLGGLIELLQTGFKILSTSIQFFFSRGASVFGFGAGFSATLIGAGYLVGFDVGLSILMGAIIATLIALPILSHLYGPLLHLNHAASVEAYIVGHKIRYIGIGAILLAGFYTLILLLRPFYKSVVTSLRGLRNTAQQQTLRTEQDLSNRTLIIGMILLLGIAYCLFDALFPLQSLGITHGLHPAFLLISLLYVLIFGFIFAAITGYFSGLVGVTASPGSSVAISAVLIAALIVRAVLGLSGHVSLMDLKEGAAITIVLASVVMGAACVANNNSNDLKVGHIVGATPYKQQIMLMVGGLVAALIIPLVMQLLYTAYGIADVVPRPNMDLTQTLPAPPAAAMAAIAQGVFHQTLQTPMLLVGAAIIVVCIIVSHLLPKHRFKLSPIGIAIGIYLPLSSSTPIFLGALLSWLVKRAVAKNKVADKTSASYRGTVLCCGLVAGAAIMNVLLAIPLAMSQGGNLLAVMPHQLDFLAKTLGAAATVGMLIYLYRLIVRE